MPRLPPTLHCCSVISSKEALTCPERPSPTIFAGESAVGECSSDARLHGIDAEARICFSQPMGRGDKALCYPNPSHERRCIPAPALRRGCWRFCCRCPYMDVLCLLARPQFLRRNWDPLRLRRAVIVGRHGDLSPVSALPAPSLFNPFRAAPTKDYLELVWNSW